MSARPSLMAAARSWAGAGIAARAAIVAILNEREGGCAISSVERRNWKGECLDGIGERQERRCNRDYYLLFQPGLRFVKIAVRQ